jgi:hypothetical protein
MGEIKKINVLFRYIILSLFTILAVRYIPEGRIKYEELLTISSIVTIVMLSLDMYLPIIQINNNNDD